MRVIQCVFGDIPEAIVPCLTSVKEIYPNVEVFAFSAVEHPLYESDKWRWQMMLENDDILYLDWDITLTNPIKIIQNDLSSMIYFQGQPDNCLIYSPKREIFQEFENDRIRRGIKFETFGWFRKVLRDKKINEITGINHLRTSGMEKLKSQYSLI